MSNLKAFDPTSAVAICLGCGCVVSETVGHTCVGDTPAAHNSSLDWNEQAAAWILALDADELDAKVLEVTDWGTSPMAGVKTVLAAWLRGEQL